MGGVTEKQAQQKRTNYPLSILGSKANDLHLDVGSTDRGQHVLHLCPHAENRAAQDEVRPASKTDLTLQAHRRLLTVPPPGGHSNTLTRSVYRPTRSGYSLTTSLYS